MLPSTSTAGIDLSSDTNREVNCEVTCALYDEDAPFLPVYEGTAPQSKGAIHGSPDSPVA